MAKIVLGRNTRISLVTENGEVIVYDVKNGDFKSVLSSWQSRYVLEFPKDDSFAQFWQLFKEYLC